MKYEPVLAVTLLAFQSTAFILLLRYLRVQINSAFLNTTLVYFSEQLKMILSFCVVFYQSSCSINQALDDLGKGLLENWKLAIPALLFSLQNNLIYYAGSNMDAATFQITSQLKILITAINMVILLNRTLRPIQWIALCILFAGIAVVQLDKFQSNLLHTNKMSGMIALLLSMFSSGFAGVFVEKVLKSGTSSMWVINFHLSMFCLMFSTCVMLINDGREIQSSGLYVGYSFWVWILIVVQGVGGLIVAYVIKKYDNIIKGFATSAAIISASTFSIIFLDTKLTPNIVVGGILVIVAILMYSR